jgi:hypothetical protein
MNIDINQEQIGAVKAHLELSDYIARNSIFDTQIK